MSIKGFFTRHLLPPLYIYNYGCQNTRFAFYFIGAVNGCAFVQQQQNCLPYLRR